jgi:hypothetical protein
MEALVPIATIIYVFLALCAAVFVVWIFPYLISSVTEAINERFPKIKDVSWNAVIALTDFLNHLTEDRIHWDKKDYIDPFYEKFAEDLERFNCSLRREERRRWTTSYSGH